MYPSGYITTPPLLALPVSQLGGFFLHTRLNQYKRYIYNGLEDFILNLYNNDTIIYSQNPN